MIHHTLILFSNGIVPKQIPEQSTETGSPYPVHVECTPEYCTCYAPGPRYDEIRLETRESSS